MQASVYHIALSTSTLALARIAYCRAFCAHGEQGNRCRRPQLAAAPAAEASAGGTKCGGGRGCERPGHRPRERRCRPAASPSPKRAARECPRESCQWPSRHRKVSISSRAACPASSFLDSRRRRAPLFGTTGSVHSRIPSPTSTPPSSTTLHTRRPSVHALRQLRIFPSGWSPQSAGAVRSPQRARHLHAAVLSAERDGSPPPERKHCLVAPAWCKAGPASGLHVQRHPTCAHPEHPVTQRAADTHPDC